MISRNIIFVIISNYNYNFSILREIRDEVRVNYASVFLITDLNENCVDLWIMISFTYSCYRSFS
jgi:hypothetical protein